MPGLQTRRIGRRAVLGGLGAAGLLAVRPAFADPALDAAALGLSSTSTDDQTDVMAAALDAALSQGRPLFLPAGEYWVQNLRIPAYVTLQGAGQAVLRAAGPAPIAMIENAAGIVLDGLSFAGSGADSSADQGLIEIESSGKLLIRDCTFNDAPGNGIRLRQAGAIIEHCTFGGISGAAIFSLDGKGMMVAGNVIDGCGNGGILIWGSDSRRDGSIVTGNVIQNIRTDGGGNGQNGNGINVYRCDDVIVADNQIANCAFTAIRLNATNNTQVRGNTCMNSGEVAIFSEFAFSGSVIADNIVDNAAGGISMTNLDQGGHLATCSGNVVRNIQPRSEVNPDTIPFGISAEADAAIVGNSVETVPGTGIAAGWGPYLRNVIVANNVVRDVDIGIAVSVADGAGAAVVTGNAVSAARKAAIAATAWTEIRTSNLVRDAASYPAITMSGNSVS